MPERLSGRAPSGLIHSDDSQIDRSSSSSRHECRYCRERHPEQLVALSSRYAVPAIFPWRQFTETGGTIGYGPNLPKTYRQIAAYTGRILKGARPSDLPVEQIDQI